MRNVQPEVRVWVDFEVRIWSKHQKMSTVGGQKKRKEHMLRQHEPGMGSGAPDGSISRFNCYIKRPNIILECQFMY